MVPVARANPTIQSLTLLYFDPKTGFNKYHLNYLYFFHPFIAFISILFSSILGKIYLIGFRGFAMTYFIGIEEIHYSWINNSYAILLSAYFWLLCVSLNSLKSFLFNIYTASKTVGRLYFIKRSNGLEIDEMVNKIDNKNVEDMKKIKKNTT